MNITRLRKKGWSNDEIAHLQKTLKIAEEHKHPQIKMLEHLSFWVLILVLSCGAVATTLSLLPILVLGTRFAVPLVLLLGACMGLFLVHVLYDLRLARRHQHFGMSVLLITSLFTITALLRTLSLGMESSALPIALLFASGMLIPYLVSWRILHEPS